jgi:hypothetical protein
MEKTLLKNCDVEQGGGGVGGGASTAISLKNDK